LNPNSARQCATGIRLFRLALSPSLTDERTSRLSPVCQSICFRDGSIRAALAAWWLRLPFGEADAKQARPVESIRNDTLQFLVPEG